MGLSRRTPIIEAGIAQVTLMRLVSPLIIMSLGLRPTGVHFASFLPPILSRWPCGKQVGLQARGVAHGLPCVFMTLWVAIGAGLHRIMKRLHPCVYPISFFFTPFPHC